MADRRTLAILYLPMTLDAFAEVSEAISRFYPTAKIGDNQGERETVVIEVEEDPE